MSGRPRLLLTADAVGGVWQYSIDLTAEVTARGGEVLIACLGPGPSDAQREQVAAIPGASLIHREFALEWMPNPWRDVDASRHWLLSLAADFDPDIVHLNGYSYGSADWKVPIVMTAHSCVFSWWRAVHGTPPGEDWAEYQRRVTEGLSRATAITAPTEFMARAVSREYGVPADKISVIHNFSRVRASQRPDKRAECFATGRLWDEAKNLKLLNQIAPKLLWDVFVAGDTPMPSESQQPFTAVHLLGQLPHPEVFRRMQSASLFLHPALYEPFGLAVVEAARAHCALVLADIPSLRELWDGAALFIDPRDPEAWIFEVNELTRDFGRRRKLSERAQRRSERFTAASSIESYLELYAQLKKDACKGAAA